MRHLQLLDLRLTATGFRPQSMPVRSRCTGKRDRLELVAQAADLAIGQFGVDQAIEPGFRLDWPPRSFGQQLAPGTLPCHRDAGRSDAPGDQ